MSKIQLQNGQPYSGIVILPTAYWRLPTGDCLLETAYCQLHLVSPVLQWRFAVGVLPGLGIYATLFNLMA